MKSTDRYRVDGISCTFGDQGPLAVANLSVGGFFVTTPRPLPPGQVLRLRVTLDAQRSFDVLAKVSWVNGAERSRAPHLPQGFGVKITQIGLADKLAILDLLKRASNEPAPRDRAERH